MKDLLPSSRHTGRQSANGVFKAREARSELLKNELAAASAANDAKTARLRALRLEKERQDAEAAASAPVPAAAARKRVRRIAG